ncbi:tyrosine-type recombinase/integrase [Salinigranum sp. GCM10025319]|uniref:tyrosine-type recombinase/integrase n=1 Tax=Salinigranum sp. GCM10025319 TaxID=3252687 RepID=UPI00361DDAF5
MSVEGTDGDLSEILREALQSEGGEGPNLRQIIREELGHEIESCDISEAISSYLESRKEELRASSLDQHRSGLQPLDVFCDEQDIQETTDLTANKLIDYKTWRKEEAPVKVDTLSKSSLKTQMSILRVFLEHCEKRNLVRQGLHEAVPHINLETHEEARDDILPKERADRIVGYLHKFAYANRVHIIWLILTETGIRLGTLVSLDLDDYERDGDEGKFHLQHRPETETPLKNGQKGERTVTLPARVCDAIDAYVSENRHGVVDDYGRRPLITTRKGRPATSTIRKYVYEWSRPCEVGQDCPYGREPEECEATKNNAANQCPSSRSPHTIRRGYITHQLNNGVYSKYVSGRCDVSEEVIEKHYDARSEDEKAEARWRAFESARKDSEPHGGK